MATTITNDADVTYVFDGTSDTRVASSNINSILLQDSTGLTLTKTSSPDEFLAGDIITYSVTITNNSGSYLNGVRIIDNLGGGNLAYISGSGRLSTSTQSYSVSPISTNPLTFTLQQLPVGATMTLVYRAQVVFNLPTSVLAITNVVNGIGYTSTGTINGSSSNTIQKKNSVSISVEKSSSVNTISPNVSFDYFLTLTNNYSSLASVENIQDQLPSNFVVNNIKVKVGTNPETILNTTDYEITSTNLLTIPSQSGPNITVPANGQTIITINGYFN